MIIIFFQHAPYVTQLLLGFSRRSYCKRNSDTCLSIRVGRPMTAIECGLSRNRHHWVGKARIVGYDL